MNKILVNKALTDKLQSIAQDIKVYININSEIANSLNIDDDSNITFFDENEMIELIDIRMKIKALTYKLKDKMSHGKSR
jgi:hypothetical protein